MTKKEVLTEFKQFQLPLIQDSEANCNGKIDYPMRRQAWNDYADYLYKDKKITYNQYMTWCNPYDF